jgi:hypothetical protein
MHLSFASTVLYYQNAIKLKCTLRSGGGRHRQAEILQDNNVLIEVKATHRQGDTLASRIFMSRGTHFSNFPDNMTEWPVYMTVGNLSWMIDQIPSRRSVVTVALLLIPITNHNIAQKQLNEQQKLNPEVLKEVL